MTPAPKTSLAVTALLVGCVSIAPLQGHLLQDQDAAGRLLASYDPNFGPPRPQATAARPATPRTESASATPLPARVFAPFAPKVTTHRDERFFYVESDACPTTD